MQYLCKSRTNIGAPMRKGGLRVRVLSWLRDKGYCYHVVGGIGAYCTIRDWSFNHVIGINLKIRLEDNMFGMMRKSKVEVGSIYVLGGFGDFVQVVDISEGAVHYQSVYWSVDKRMWKQAGGCVSLPMNGFRLSYRRVTDGKVM